MAYSYSYKGQFGWAAESTYDTPVTPTIFDTFQSESVRATVEERRSNEIRGDRRTHRTHMRRLGKQSVAGTITQIAKLEDQLLIWEAALGSMASAQEGSTAAYTHTITPADALPSLTLEIERDAQAFTYSGVKIPQLVFTCNTNNPWVTLAWDVLGSGTLVTGASPTAATYAAQQRLWTPEEATLEIDSSEVDVISFDLTIANALHADGGSYSFNRVRKALNPFGKRMITGNMLLHFEDTTEMAKILAATASKLEFTLTGGTIEDTYKEQLKITLPEVFYNGEHPVIEGEENEITVPIAFGATYDGTNAEIKVEITNRDTQQ